MELFDLLAQSGLCLHVPPQQMIANVSFAPTERLCCFVRNVLTLSDTYRLQWVLPTGLRGDICGVMAFGQDDRGVIKAVVLYANGERALRQALLALPTESSVELWMLESWMRMGAVDIVEVEEVRSNDPFYMLRGRRRGRRSNEEYSIQTSRDPLLTQVRSLLHGAGRREHSCFVVEGELLCARAMEDGLPILHMLYTPDLMRGSEGVRLYERARQLEAPLVRLSEGLMAKLTTSRPVPSMLAVIEARLRNIDRFHFGAHSLVLGVENINNPDNLGMTLRTADAAGVEGVIIAGQKSDPFHKNCVRAARGAVGRIPLVYCDDLAKAATSLAAQGVQVIAATGSARQEMWAVPFRPPALLLVGNEQEGLTKEVLEACSWHVRIPMAPGQDSLNVGVAAGILLYEMQRRRYELDRAN